MLGHHVLGAEGTDIHHPGSWLLEWSLLGHCELCIRVTAHSWEGSGDKSVFFGYGLV